MSIVGSEACSLITLSCCVLYPTYTSMRVCTVWNLKNSATGNNSCNNPVHADQLYITVFHNIFWNNLNSRKLAFSQLMKLLIARNWRKNLIHVIVAPCTRPQQNLWVEMEMSKKDCTRIWVMSTMFVAKFHSDCVKTSSLVTFAWRVDSFIILSRRDGLKAVAAGISLTNT